MPAVESAPVPAPSTDKKPRPWYHRPGVVAAFLIFFFPLGLLFMWQGKVFPVGVRWAVTGFLALLVFANVVSKRNHPRSSTAMAAQAPKTEANTHRITKTVDEFRAESVQDLNGEPDTTGTNANGNKFYTWNREFVSTTLITDGSESHVIQANVIASRANNDVDVKSRLVINAVGIMQARQMIESANNGKKDYKRFDDVFNWLGEHYDKKGSTRTVGNVTVAVGESVVNGSITLTVFNIY